MGESLWGTRAVAEYAYCPRLFYYMEVEGVFAPSADTERGIALHRRVDKPSGARDPTDEERGDSERPKAVRSLALTSDKLSLTATLDLVEFSGARAIPIEYRKGRPRRVVADSFCDGDDEIERATVEAWPTDRIQVGLQALLLEEAGYKVEEAIIYYAAEKLRLKIAVDEDLRNDAARTLEEAKRCAEGERPLPLANDPRCPKCSLAPICLPDEINFQRADSPVGELTPRAIWPPRDDGIHLVAQSDGAKVGVRGMELRLTDKDGALTRSVPLANIESLSLVGSIQITTQAIRTLTERARPIAFLSPAGRLVAMIDPLDSVSAQVRRAQVRAFDRADVCLELTRALVSAKIVNQRTLLMRNHGSLPAEVADDLAKEAKKARHADSIDAARGHEGQAASLYFRHFAGIFKGAPASEFATNGRKRRPPPDPINSCLSFGYSMLTHECVSAARLARLEPSIGGFHVSRPSRPALALDLMEPFRPLIADSVAIGCFNRGELSEGHFFRSASGCLFTDAGRRNFFKALGRRMATEVTHPFFGYRLSYRRMIVLHARMVAAWLMGEIPRLEFLTTR